MDAMYEYDMWCHDGIAYAYGTRVVRDDDTIVMVDDDVVAIDTNFITHYLTCDDDTTNIVLITQCMACGTKYARRLTYGEIRTMATYVTNARARDYHTRDDA